MLNSQTRHEPDKNQKKQENMKNIFDLINSMKRYPLNKNENFLREITAIIAGKIMMYRKEHDLSQEQFAEKFGLSKEVVEKIESGDMNIALELVKSLKKHHKNLNNSVVLNN